MNENGIFFYVCVGLQIKTTMKLVKHLPNGAVRIQPPGQKATIHYLRSLGDDADDNSDSDGDDNRVFFLGKIGKAFKKVGKFGGKFGKKFGKTFKKSFKKVGKFSKKAVRTLKLDKAAKALKLDEAAQKVDEAGQALHINQTAGKLVKGDVKGAWDEAAQGVRAVPGGGWALDATHADKIGERALRGDVEGAFRETREGIENIGRHTGEGIKEAAIATGEFTVGIGSGFMGGQADAMDDMFGDVKNIAIIAGSIIGSILLIALVLKLRSSRSKDDSKE